MVLKLSTALREGLAASSDMRTLLNECFINIYSGPVPPSADSELPPSAVLLNTISVGGMGDPLTLEPDAPGGVITKSVAENWTGNNVADGTPTFFRLVKATDTGSATTTEVRIQGSAGGVGNDMVITELPLVEDAPLSFDFFQLVIPEQ